MPNHFFYLHRLKINHINSWKNMCLFLSIVLSQTLPINKRERIYISPASVMYLCLHLLQEWLFYEKTGDEIYRDAVPLSL
jgi:hypothetical protein